MILLRLITLALPAQASSAIGADDRRDRARCRTAGWHAHRQRFGAAGFQRHGGPHRRKSATVRSARGTPGFNEDVLERVQSVPEVRAAAPVIEAEVETGIKGQGKLLIVAVDMTGDRSLRDYDLDSGDEDAIDDPLVFMAQPDSLILTSDFAARNQSKSGSKHHVRDHRGAAAVHRPRAAQGRRDGAGVRRQSRDHGHLRRAARVRPRPPVRPHRHRPARGRHAGTGRGRNSEGRRAGASPWSRLPAARATSKSCSASIRWRSRCRACSRCCIGMFIIYNSFAIAVTQRRSEIGILRALGATRGQIRTLFLAESARRRADRLAGRSGPRAGLRPQPDGHHRRR